MAFGISEGFVSPTVQYNDSYFSPDYKDALARYTESIDLMESAYKEQQYWVGVYERAQQLGLRGHTVQEVLLNLQRVSQKLQNIEKLSMNLTKKEVQNDSQGMEDASKEFQDS